MLTRTIRRSKNDPKPSNYSLTQCRLDVIVQGLPEHANAVNETWAKIRGKPHVYTYTVLVERARELDEKIASLEPQVQRPPEETTPEDWMNWRRRLARMEGQRFAIQRVLDGNTSGVGSGPSTSTSAPAPEDWTNDPFLSE